MHRGSLLSKTDFARKSVNDVIVEETVDYILYRDIITTVSLDNIDCVLLKDETVILPQITRGVSRKILWGKYCILYLEAGD